MDRETLIRELIAPPEEFTPIPFWFFDDEPDEKRIRQQLTDYVEKGVNGFVLHPRIGIPKHIAYLSDAFFKAVRFIVKTAAQLGMKVVLYDEGMYPSGSAHGLVVKANPDFASRGITLTDEPKGREILVRLADGKCIVRGFTGGTIRGIHFGEDDGQANAPKSADILNPEAVRTFIHLTHDRYYQELKEYFGNTIIGFFTDEPCALGRNAGAFREWVPGMEREIEREGGRLADLEGLFTGQENATTRIYHRLIKRHLRENFYAQLSDWCKAHQIALMGHPEVSDDVEEELYFQVPGQDLIMRRVAPETGGLLEFDSVQAKLCADIARHLGRRRNLNECFGVCNRKGIPWYFTGGDMKWYLDWMGVRGVNLFVPHAFYYSVAGERSGERPPDVGPNNIWWPYYKKYSDYMKRLSWLMTDSVNDAKVAVLCDNNRVPYREVAELYENQIAFNYLPAALLLQCRLENGRLIIRDYEYETVLNVIGDEYGEMLTGVKVVRSAQELLGESYRTVVTDAPCPGLRAAGLQKYGIKMYFFSNEGAEAIETDLTLTESESWVCFDLWAGKAFRATPGKLRLRPLETLLVIPAELAWASGFAEKKEHFLGDWTEQFSMMQVDGTNGATYRYTYLADALDEDAVFAVRGEEMAECFCNGKLVDVSFWSPHRFAIGPFLKVGENEIRLRFTGSAANIYSDARLPVGLERFSTSASWAGRC